MTWEIIDAERHRLADLLDDLSPTEWASPSLCAGWTVHDVAAHLTLQDLGLGAVIATVARGGGNLDRATSAAARRRAAALGPERIPDVIRAGSRRPNFGVTPLETLIDLLVHTQDIALALGRSHAMPVQAAATAATRVWTTRWPPPFPAVRALRGLRLRATDVDWSVGDGPLVEGPIAALLLLSTGRPSAIAQLPHADVDELTARLK
ncbi:maleylpyruvate isomerase family mycothiol-dependent enzyme [Cryptosporangium phraense]|uniref:Maleylpyruvate isomerase family mycothiol-dependent enzyme n=1 Tax=Cryptosporangium phraense TaxID=2593070 RepID=A0A545AQT2_9ACTN|nr:maleylpyruvate isomerase family mycothiol-dependent enzyme [Cryptosporangium phraense]TQS43677.1 maleylpyruvate isomerase family mycothiol-dependent enzyme [Cryptosporangium phraense]